ncbi:hypothetical protein MCEMAEM4_02951 [Burkholderiaceae bacterium]
MLTSTAPLACNKVPRLPSMFIAKLLLMPVATDNEVLPAL